MALITALGDLGPDNAPVQWWAAQRAVRCNRLLGDVSADLVSGLALKEYRGYRQPVVVEHILENVSLGLPHVLIESLARPLP